MPILEAKAARTLTDSRLQLSREPGGGIQSVPAGLTAMLHEGAQVVVVSEKVRLVWKMQESLPSKAQRIWWIFQTAAVTDGGELRRIDRERM